MSLLPLSVTWDVAPGIFTIFGLEVRWYGLTWVAAIFAGIWLMNKIFKREQLNEKALDHITWSIALSMIVGSRLGHLLFYDFQNFIADPSVFFRFRDGGLASHGAALGILFGLWLFARKAKLPYVWALDRISLAVPIGGAAIRIGNLMNSEIYGPPTDLPWGFIFVRDGQSVPMHPTQIYEALCYLLLFGILWWLYFGKDAGRKMPGMMIGVMLTGVFASRFLIEFIKLPQEAFEENMALNMGQILSIPFILAGLALIVWSVANHKKNPDPADPVRRSFYYVKNQPKATAKNR
jgi:prolipoprotein diacylglyceryl transferase